MPLSPRIALAALPLLACGSSSPGGVDAAAVIYCYEDGVANGYDECGPILAEYQTLATQCSSVGTTLTTPCPTSGALGTCNVTLQETGFWDGPVTLYKPEYDTKTDASPQVACTSQNPGVSWNPAP